MMGLKRRGKRQAFTLVELVIVIAIIGILAAIAIPRFIDLRLEAYNAQRDGMVGGIRAGIMLAASKNQVSQANPNDTFPPNLEATWGGITTPAGAQPGAFPTACDVNNCFELVLNQPINDANWSQTAAAAYKFDAPVDAADKSYTYTQATGRFE